MCSIHLSNDESVRLPGRFWIFCCLLMVIFGCGGDGGGEFASEEQEPSSVSLSVRWHEPEQTQGRESDAVAKTAPAVSCADLAIDTVQFLVYDEHNQQLASSPNWSCVNGRGESMNIPPGNRHFVVLGRDADGDIIYHGISTATISPGEQTRVGPIDAYAFLPIELKADRVADTQIDISWTAADERARIDGYQVYSITDDTTAFDGSGTYSDQGLMASTLYRYQISAHDEFGNVSKLSVPLDVKTTNRIPDTGQANSPDAHGDDGEYIKNPPSYSKMDADGNLLNDDATDWAMVKDNVTGLVWEVKSKATGTHHAGDAYTWNGANEFIGRLNRESFGRHADWRLPSIVELLSLYYPVKSGVTMNSTYFPNSDVTIHVQDFDSYEKLYWTSVQHAVDGRMAWGVSFSDHIVNPWLRLNRFFVRAVRGDPELMLLVDNQDGTVTDKSTGLMWAKLGPLKTAPFYDGVENKWIGLTWTAALSACEGLSFAGYDDWRLPNVKELSSIMVHDRQRPSIDSAFFNEMPVTLYPYPFWSSTTSAKNQSADHNPEAHAYTVHFLIGEIGFRLKSHSDPVDIIYVRPVRDVTPD